MANGSTKRGPAVSDAIHDEGAKHDRYLQRQIDKERTKLKTLPADHPYRAEMDSVSEVTIGKEGVKLKSRQPWLQFGMSLLAFLAFIAWLFKR